MLNEQESEVKFLNGLCEAIKGLDKETQLFIAKTYLEPKQPEKVVYETSKKDTEDMVDYEEFYNRLTDNMDLKSHDYARKLYNEINQLFKLRHYQ